MNSNPALTKALIDATIDNVDALYPVHFAVAFLNHAERTLASTLECPRVHPSRAREVHAEASQMFTVAQRLCSANNDQTARIRQLLNHVDMLAMVSTSGFEMQTRRMQEGKV